jgi:ribonuclease HII
MTSVVPVESPAVGLQAPASPVGARRRSGTPTLRFERRLLRDGVSMLASMDEVGRGAPAGPVHVGVVVIGPDSPPAPAGVRDSKLLTPQARAALVPAIERWALAWAVGAAGPDEVDGYGVVGALRLAGCRALASLAHPPDLVLLDGSHDWLTEPPATPGPEGRGTAPAGAPDGAAADRTAPAGSMPAGPTVTGPTMGGPGSARTAPTAGARRPPVVTRVKADLTCASVAAASVLAKVARDEVMAALDSEYPDYGFAANKGYGTPDHLEALGRLGPTPHHRVSWRLPDRR